MLGRWWQWMCPRVSRQTTAQTHVHQLTACYHPLHVIVTPYMLLSPLTCDCHPLHVTVTPYMWLSPLTCDCHPLHVTVTPYMFMSTCGGVWCLILHSIVCLCAVLMLSLCFLDNQFIATASYDRTFKLWGREWAHCLHNTVWTSDILKETFNSVTFYGRWYILQLMWWSLLNVHACCIHCVQ